MVTNRKQPREERLKAPKVAVLTGSDSDLAVVEETCKKLADFSIPYEVRITSAHRSPERTLDYARSAERRGMEVIIVAAGAAAHLAGVVASVTILPVLAVPIDSTSLSGLDALLASVQMPAGVPVATLAIGKPGGANAAILAAEILARNDPLLAQKLRDFKKELARGIEEKDRKLQLRIRSGKQIVNT
jgi:phosphoribosylaminoimidazole carboxylase PurE protein